MYVGIDARGRIQAVSDRPFSSGSLTVLGAGDIPECDRRGLIGKRYRAGPAAAKGPGDLRVAMVCNWGDQCGIATYSQFLVEALRGVVAEVKVFAELPEGQEEWSAED